MKPQALFTFLIVMAWTLSGEAQTKKSSWDYQQFDWNKAYQSQSFSGYYKEGGEFIDLKMVKGSPYFVAVFMPGKVSFQGKTSKDFYIRYNAFGDEIEVKEELSATGVKALLKDPEITAEFNGELFVYVEDFINDKDEKNSGYMSLIHQGPQYTVYLQKRKIFKRGKEARTSFESGFPDQFVDEYNYYISENGQPATYIKMNKRSLTDLADGSQKNSLKQFIRDNNIDTDAPEDIEKLFRFIEQSM
ncbi:hypothetical protein [Robertkochia flava]|uniref:hypothetical protein n=1 Tax=Robertkochia flava TaxID=3447986 RepID=UPI001CCEBBC8|nr:hypothetical protein [Robertkochia marina]